MVTGILTSNLSNTEHKHNEVCDKWKQFHHLFGVSNIQDECISYIFVMKYLTAM